MGVIPKTTTPLTKFIRTGEGVLVFAFNLAMLIVPIVSNSLSPEDAVKWAGIVNGVAVISRTGLKVVSEFSKATGIEPQPIGNLPPQVITADAGGAASNGGAPEIVDNQEFASTPSDDDDAVSVPEVVNMPSDNGDAANVPAVAGSVSDDDDAVDAPAAPVAVDSSDPDISDEEEFSSVPSASDGEDDAIAPEPAGGDADPDGSPELVGAGVSGVPNPIVINPGDEPS